MRPVVRLSLRRFIHAPPAPAAPRRIPARTALAVGAALAVTGFAAWRIAHPDQRIALDAHPATPAADAASSRAPIERRRERVEPPAAQKPAGPPAKADTEPAVPDAPADTDVKGAPDATADPDATDAAEESSEGAFNPLTGEINWDCPCLGGMAHGPCGEQFRAAFSCFVFSEAEPKGIDCVERFKSMQDCFREHPDIYGEEIADDEDDVPDRETAGDQASETEPAPGKPEALHPAPLSDVAEMSSQTKSREEQ